MKCSCCKNELKITHFDFYNVNPRNLNKSDEGYQCLNPKCVANSFQVSWNSKGEIFYRQFLLNQQMIDVIISKFSEENITNAIDSESRKHEKGAVFCRKNTRKIKIGKYGILIQPYYKDLDNCKKVRRIISFQKNDETIITWYYMTSYLIKQFLHNYRNKRYEKCNDMLIDEGPIEGNTFKQKPVYKITMWLISFVFYKKCKIIKNSIK